MPIDLRLVGEQDRFLETDRPLPQVTVVCCSSEGLPHSTLGEVIEALSPIAACRAVVLSEAPEEAMDGAETVTVPRATKLAKLRGVSKEIVTDLVCVCDPDVLIARNGCRAILLEAVRAAREGGDVVAFGVVEGGDDGGLLSRVIIIDKWLSHRVLRPLLWRLGVGITLPGQFLVFSSRLLRELDPNVDTHLDDLYLGWIARTRNARVVRSSDVVGEEKPRSTWGSLIAQRLRWMRGLARLFAHLRSRPAAAIALLMHYGAYHALPMLLMVGVMWASLESPLVGMAAILVGVGGVKYASGQSWPAAAVYIGVFPVIHLLATLFWWVPVRRSFLTRR